MGHQLLTPTGKKFLGLPIMKPDRPAIETQSTVAPRIHDTQKQLEKLHREQLTKRAAARGAAIRNKSRAGQKKK